MKDEEALIAHYKQYFRTVKANNPTLKDEAYRLRYEVYKNKGIISAEKNNSKDMEYDQFDDSALHSLLLHKKSKRAIGYIRLIPYIKEESVVKQLPIENYCENINGEQLHHAKTGEISRMLIHPSFRRRSSDHTNQVITIEPQNTENRRFAINYLPMCITLAGLNLMVLANLEYAVALMERSLAIKLRRQGVSLKKVGEPINLFGLRSPYVIDTEKTCSGIKSKQPVVYELFNIISDEFNSKT
ncbi:MAG: PEP-CTERM/exosortase system-associated acyltransferase [Endozoicomonadaceae bacterium]|nr:PEP-CTERM/exosortase system-associated acyltransferase [Endozoicomonadaceae bacterium]